MFLSDKDLRLLLREEKLIIEPLEHWQVRSTSINLHLGPLLVKYSAEEIHIGRSTPEHITYEIDQKNGYKLLPKEFVLCSTYERVTIPNGYQGFVFGRGDIARAGLQVHNVDPHIDPGSNHVITLEITNNNGIPVVIYPYIGICKLYVAALLHNADNIYDGKYLGQTTPTVYCPDKYSIHPNPKPLKSKK
jgi:dCTP deaminase